MPYSQITDLTSLLPVRELLQLADDVGGLDGDDLAAAADGVGPEGPLSPDQAALRLVLLDAIEAADREIDGYVGLVRAVPMAAPPRIVRNMSARLAVGNLFARRPHLEPGPWKEVQAGIRRTLEKIADGRLSLGPKPGETAQPESHSVEVVTPTRLFGPQAWEQY